MGRSKLLSQIEPSNKLTRQQQIEFIIDRKNEIGMLNKNDPTYFRNLSDAGVWALYKHYEHIFRTFESNIYHERNEV